MIRILVTFLAASFALPVPAPAQDDLRGPVIDVRHYRFSLTLSDASDEIRGRAEITVRFMEPGKESFTLDLVGGEAGSAAGMEVLGVARGNSPLSFLHQEDRLTVSTASPPGALEDRTYTIDYRGVPADGLIIGTNKYGDRAFFGDNWPNRARHWLPTVDHVSDKATVEWIVTAPIHYEVVATGRLVERSDMGDGTRLTHWASTAPVATKVMTMGAARFAMRVTGVVGEIPVQAWVYPQDRAAGFHDFARAENALRFFESRVGPFSYAKLANVQSKTRYGGMENASNIFYSERAVRGDGRNENLIVHEVAHQWFGDSVTELEWPHLWLSEGFATYFTHLYNEAEYGRAHLVEGMLRDRRTVIRFLGERPDLALVPESLSDPNEMLNPNAYQKGSWILHMLRRQVGDQDFWAGIRRYYREFRDRNALTVDFQRAMEESSGQDLEWFFQQWSHERGHPVLRKAWSYDTSRGEVSLTVSQIQDTGTIFRFFLDVGVIYPGGDGKISKTVEVTAPVQVFSIPVREAPEEVILDPETWLLFEAEETEDEETAPAGNPTGAASFILPGLEADGGPCLIPSRPFLCTTEWCGTSAG
ncbi:MAG: M1 family aminopeptidase [Longimicrobiales bacterium]